MQSKHTLFLEVVLHRDRGSFRGAIGAVRTSHSGLAKIQRIGSMYHGNECRRDTPLAHAQLSRIICVLTSSHIPSLTCVYVHNAYTAAPTCCTTALPF